MSQVTFTNPANGDTYVFETNPHAEATAQRIRQIERLSNTGNVGATKQQGDEGPHIIDWTIYVSSYAMEVALWSWYVLTRSQTIYVTDWLGEQVEGQIIMLQRQRQLGLLNGNPYATYEFQFEVYRFIAGPMFDAGVTP